MASKQVVDRQKSSAAVVAAATTHASRVAAAVQTTLSPVPTKNNAPPDVEGMILTVARWLDGTCVRMVNADEVHAHELSDDEAPRQRREDSVVALAEELGSVRALIGGVYGSAAKRAFGFVSDTPRDPTMLSRFAGEVSKALREKKLPKASRSDMTVKWSPLATADRIDELRSNLDDALADVAKEAREAESTLANRNAALDAYDDAFRRSASLLVGLFTFAGETALANRVRPSARRPGQTEELTPSAPAGTPETDAASDEAASTQETDAAPLVGATPANAKKTTKGR